MKNLVMDLLIEASVVGIVLVIVGTGTSFVVGTFTKTDLPPACKDWNKNYAMEFSLFFTGFVSHLLFEVTGINKYYCKNGVACKN